MNAEQPHLEVVRGNPDDVELAALVAAVALVTAAPERPEPPRRTSAWADRSRQTRGPLPHGPAAWRWSLA
ncbi:acyl-CoA carboxylase subunit epsilon [Saccharothrix coeruleofusca]|uniref:Acyl-CoA carboxylase epsilon subunit-like protein n=1 Tax=Saccharothrix coeruleofusca TaxID=33919 RepID=A0A918AQA6_9PSEU|nr:acyl-CoA carboxylase subunit epsilon [Saccharothrix coeruleofusca]GGP70328.1 hypothetical protein GCM10010185_49210 [Saccharothrix coeruleofusca]